MTNVSPLREMIIPVCAFALTAEVNPRKHTVAILAKIVIRLICIAFLLLVSYNVCEDCR